MLAKTGFSAHSEGFNFVYRPFTLKDENIKSIRQRSISQIGRCLSSTNLRISLRALASLESALREPLPVFDMELSDEDREQWRPEQLEILTLIADVAQRSTDPVTLIRIRAILWWHRIRSPSEEVKERAEAVVYSIPESFELRLTRGLMNPFRIDEWQPTEDSEDDGNRFRQEKSEKMQHSLVAELLNRSEHASMAYEILTERIQTINAAGVQSSPQVILGVLGSTYPEFAAVLCDIIADNPSGPLAPYLFSLLTNVRVWHAERARGIAQRVLIGGTPVLCRGVALSYKSLRWADNATEEDIEVIKGLLNHEDLGVRDAAIE